MKQFQISFNNEEEAALSFRELKKQILPGSESRMLQEIAEDIRKAFEVISFPQAGNRSVSLGVTQRKEHEDEDSLVLRVDQALYEAKKEGKNRSVLL